MFLSEIIIYPIKSLAGIRLNESKVESRGLQYDRRWMLVDENNHFITARKYYKLLLFDIKLMDDGFEIKHRESGDTLEIPFGVNEGERVTVKVWKDEVEAITGHESWGEWFSDKLEISCKLVYMPNDANRLIGETWRLNDEVVSFADGYPLLVAGSASLADINNKLNEHITIDRFRPNIIFSGGRAYEEFLWKDFEIGTVKFRGLKPCARCVLTTINPITGEKGKEPLMTLAKQKVDGKVVFGQHALAVENGVIRVEDSINVITKKDSPYQAL